MTSKTKKILVYVCTALVLAGAAIGVVCEVVPTHDAAETVAPSEVVADTTTVVDSVAVVDSVVAE